MIEGTTKTALEECLEKHGYERQRIGKNPDRWIHEEHRDFVADLSGEKPIVGVEIAGMIHKDGHGRTAVGDVQMAVALILEAAENTAKKAEPLLNLPQPLNEQQAKPTIIPPRKENPTTSQPEQNPPEPQNEHEKKGKWVQCKTCKVDFFVTGEEALEIRDVFGGLFCEKHRSPEPSLNVTQEKAKEHEKEYQKTQAGKDTQAKEPETNSKNIGENKGDKMNENKLREVLPAITAAEPALSINVIKQYLCPEATDAEAYNFLQLCVHRKLNPFLREAYLVKYKGAAATMIVGKDAFYRKAQESGKLKGIESGIIVRDPTGAIVERESMFMYPAPDEKSKGDVLLGGWAKVYRNDQEKPTVVKVGLNEYIKIIDGRPQRNWATMPATMICKVAKVNALREAFTAELGGCYDATELGME